MSKLLIVGFVLALISGPMLHGQTPSDAPSAPNADAANPTPAGQAPDAVMKKLSELVNASKYAEAQQLTAGMLRAPANFVHPSRLAWQAGHPGEKVMIRTFESPDGNAIGSRRSSSVRPASLSNCAPEVI
jgi:hypothetical protein